MDFDNVYIHFSTYKDRSTSIDTLKSNYLVVKTGLYDSSSYQATCYSFGNIFASCLECFDFLSSYKLICMSDLISSNKDTIKSGTNLLTENKLRNNIGNNGVTYIDSIYKLKAGVNVFYFEVSVGNRAFSNTDTLFVDSLFGY